MVLNDGLHQFLQIKEKLEVTAENLTASFISNVQFFKNYGKNLYGLTGTLGSEEEQNTLKEIYEIGISYIPTFKLKRLIEYPLLIKPNDSDWVDSITNSAISEYYKNRVVLIINRTINHALNLRQMIWALGEVPEADIISYYNNEIQNEVVEDELDSRKIIIATNLAGRGTDIEISDRIDQNGGTHVILTFLPRNVRIQYQAYGRAARKGQKGTWQLLANIEELQGYYGSWIDNNYYKLRDAQEAESQIELKDYFIDRTLKNDMIFADFITFINDKTKIKHPHHK